VIVRRVLVVDDHPMNVIIASEVLTCDGFEVASASDAVEAMQQIEVFRPELILMDIQLPGVDGLALTRQIKADPSRRHIVIVAFTAFAMRGDEEKMRAAGCDGYISKPIDVNRFAGQIRQLLEPPGDTGLQKPQ
jgi:CheY-like chemotaxis protein